MKRKNQAFTLLELIVVIAVIGILFAIGIPSYDAFIQRAKTAKCMSHMRSLHMGFMAHWEEVGEWPQQPEFTEDVEELENDYYKFWVTTLEKRNVGFDTWICPADPFQEHLVRQKRGSNRKFYGSYTPNPFGKGRNKPFEHNQPWLVERGNFHKRGALIVMPDGAITTWRNAFSGR